MTETGHIVETGTASNNAKETGHTVEIDYMTEMIHIVETGHIVEIDHETTVEMSIRRKVINIREGLEIIMKTSMRTGMIGINMNANSEMTNMTKLEVGQKNNLAHMVIKIVIVHTCTKSCHR